MARARADGRWGVAREGGLALPPYVCPSPCAPRRCPRAPSSLRSAPAVSAASPTRGFPPRTLAPGRDAFGGLLAPRFVREGPRGQQVGESQLVGQVQQRHLVPEMGPRSASIPAPYGVGIGPETASDLRPRQPRLLLEQLQPPREVGRHDVDYSAVVNSLSRHSPVLPQDGNPRRDGVRSASSRSQPRPGALGEAAACLPKGCGGLPLSPSICAGFFCCRRSCRRLPSPRSPRCPRPWPRLRRP